MANDTCVVDKASADAAAAGNYLDASISATMVATYQVMVGPWPKNVTCMQNQLNVITNTTTWQSFGFPWVGLCGNYLGPGGLPSKVSSVSE
jgi:hypothetical protein